MSLWKDNEEIKRLQEYLRIKTDHPDPDYDECVKFLKKQAEDLDLPAKVYELKDPKKRIVLITWTGSEPELSSIVLNSHMDVAPVGNRSYWTHPPFGAEIDDEGKIFARGTQDMKSIGMLYLAAIRALKIEGANLKRTVHIAFVPDFECESELDLLDHFKEEFKSLNVGFGMDKNLAHCGDWYVVDCGVPSKWKFKIHCHPTLDIDRRWPNEKFNDIFEKLKSLDTTSDEKGCYEFLDYKDNIKVLWTKIEEGKFVNNKIPTSTSWFEVILGLHVDHNEFEKKLKEYCDEIPGTEIEFELKERPFSSTVLDDSCPFWCAFKTAADELGITYKTKASLCGAGAQGFREVGIPAIGFSPFINTEFLAHMEDEFITVETYLKGIEVYKKILFHIGQVE